MEVCKWLRLGLLSGSESVRIADFQLPIADWLRNWS